jgi:hypothetical protein
MRAIAADIDVQPDPNLAAKTANAAIEAVRRGWQSFLGDLAEFHSRLMRHCLMLVARNYDEQRQIEIRGQYGWQPMKAFAGQDLRSQVNVRVLPGSLETKSQQGMAAQLGGQNAARPQGPIPLASPGPLSPEQAAPTALTPRQ